MSGYLFAIEMGAQVILDTDDDNIPAAAVPYVLDTDANGDVCADVVNRSQIAWNAYRHFGVPHLHNRGSPLPALPPFPGPSHRERERARARLYVFMCARGCSCLCDTHTHTHTHTHTGLPLRHVRPGQPLEYEEPQLVRPLIQQGVVHCDPDLDAIQRLTMSPSYTSDVTFSEV